MFRRNKLKKQPKQAPRKMTDTEKNIHFGVFNALSTSQRSAVGTRDEICSNAMNNNQRLAALHILRNTSFD